MQADAFAASGIRTRFHPTSPGRRFKARLAVGLSVLALLLALLLALIPLIAIGSFIISRGIGVIQLDFFTQDPPGDLSAVGGGIRNAIVGTLEMTGLATLIALPCGLLIAIFNAEVGGRLAIAIRFAIDVLAGLPSIVVGIFVYETVVVTQGHFSGFAGSVALAVIMLPVIVVSTEEMLRLTPRPVAEGVRALGISRWRSFLAVLLPTALSGIFTGVLLAVSRAIGETAPLIFTALGNNFFTLNMNEPVQGLPLLIYRNALNSAFPAARDRAMGAALVLVAIVLIFNLLGRWLVARRRPTRQCRCPTMGDERNLMITELEAPATPTMSTEDVLAGQRPPPAAEDVVIRMRGVNAFYGSRQVVRDVNLDVRTNAITAIIGPSGSGKSTLLRCIDRMHEIIPGARTTGTIEYRGIDIYDAGVDPAAVRRTIGMVFQQPNPFPTMSIADNVSAPARFNGLVKGKVAERELVERCLRHAALWDEVKDKLHHSGTSLSGGQQQRLCIARALAMQPDVLLMDEPCSALDPIATLQVEQLMTDLRADYTIVIVTHNMQQASRVSDRTAFFTMAEDLAGYLVEVDDTVKIFTNPAERLTEDYISGRFG